MKDIALLYHDVIPHCDFESSGFRGVGANIYKLEQSHFEKHLDAIVRANPRALITIDDGGVSAIHTIAPMLEQRQLRGHFFIATDYIGQSGFLSSEQICELRRCGHEIGTHSCSHPERITHC